MRAVFFGDSFTYGHGLADCVEPNDEDDGIMFAGPSPSKLGWAARVSENLGLPCVNLSAPGASNLQILWTVRNANLNRDDLVFIEWSYPHRSCLLGPSITQIGPWMNDEISLSYYRTHPEQDMLNRNLLIIEHAALLLSQKVSRWMFLAHTVADVDPSLRHLMVDYFEKYQCDVAIDQAHPGMASNAAWAEAVTQHVQRKLQNNEWTI